MDPFMEAAFAEAYKALAKGDVPIGAVVVKDGAIIGRGHNSRESDHDPSGHAEVNALRQAGQTLGSWRLDGCDLYCTHEPCPMCGGAAMLALIHHIIFAAVEPKFGACGSQMNLVQFPGFPHNVRIVGPTDQAAGQALTRSFFEKQR